MAKIRDTSDLPSVNSRIEEVGKIAGSVKTEYEVPSGYISIELSTNGLLGAPKRFHTRNFDTSDLLNLALSEDEELPEKVAKMLDNLILEEDVSVMNFHEKEVVEYLARLYQAFYSGTLRDVDFPWTDDDLEFLKKTVGNTTEYESRVDDLKSRRWVPKMDVDIAAVETHDLDPETFRTNMTLTEKKTGFSAGFSFPRYGDVIVLRNFIMQQFRETDKQFASLRDTLRFRRDAEERMRRGEDISLSRIPNIPDFEKDKFRTYETEKSIFSAIAIKALHLVSFDGRDVSNLPLKERIELAKDPRIDYKMMKTVTEFYQKMHVGIKETVSILNPIKGVVEPREYSFRLIDLLQAVKLYEPDEYDITFEPSHSE